MSVAGFFTTKISQKFIQQMGLFSQIIQYIILLLRRICSILVVGVSFLFYCGTGILYDNDLFLIFFFSLFISRWERLW